MEHATHPNLLSERICLTGGQAHDTGTDLAKINVNGGAIAIAHPLRANGTRITTTLVNALQQRGGRYELDAKLAMLAAKVASSS